MTKQDKFVKDLLNKQYEIVGSPKTYKDVIGNEDWMSEFKLTTAQAQVFWAWGHKAYRKRFKTSSADTMQGWSAMFNKFSFPLEDHE